MKNRVIAERYTAALFELAQENQQVEAYGEILGEIVALLNSEQGKEIKLILEHPVVKKSDKKEVLEKILANKIPQELLNFLFVLVDKKRELCLGDIHQEFQRLLNELNQTVMAEVVTAVPMYRKTQTILQQQLENYLNQKVVMHCETDPSLLGGVTIKVGDRMIDGSLKTQMAQMAQILI